MLFKLVFRFQRSFRFGAFFMDNFVFVSSVVHGSYDFFHIDLLILWLIFNGFDPSENKNPSTSTSLENSLLGQKKFLCPKSS